MSCPLKASVSLLLKHASPPTALAIVISASPNIMWKELMLFAPFLPDHFKEVELDALHSSVNALNARLRKHMQESKANSPQKQMPGKKNYVDNAQISMLKSQLEKLSLLNSENTKKVKFVESTLRTQERSSRESSLPKL